MQPKYTLLFVFLWCTMGYGQLITQKTSAIKLNVQQAGTATYPDIKWISPVRDETGTENNRIDIETFINSASNITGITLQIINAGLSTPAIMNIDVPEGNKSFTLKKNIRLFDGVNTLEVIVKNEQGAEAKGIRTVRVGKENNLLDVNRKDYALLIATDNYYNWNDLVNPIFDATIISQKLKEKYGFEIELLKNPSKEDIILAIKKYGSRSYHSQDQLFIFIAGHGQYDPGLGDGYVVVKESIKNDPSRSSYLAHANLRQYINNINCKHIFVTMDVCFGGTFDEKLIAKRSAYDEPDNSEWLAQRLGITTRRYFTSGGKEYVPDGTAGNHSPFAKKFIEALNSNGHDDQVLTLIELQSYFQRLNPVPRAGAFGSNEPGSDFLFMMR